MEFDVAADMHVVADYPFLLTRVSQPFDAFVAALNAEGDVIGIALWDYYELPALDGADTNFVNTHGVCTLARLSLGSLPEDTAYLLVGGAVMPSDRLTTRHCIKVQVRDTSAVLEVPEDCTSGSATALAYIDCRTPTEDQRAQLQAIPKPRAYSTVAVVLREFKSQELPTS